MTLFDATPPKAPEAFDPAAVPAGQRAALAWHLRDMLADACQLEAPLVHLRYHVLHLIRDLEAVPATPRRRPG